MRMINIDIVTSHIFDTVPRKTTHEKHSIRYNGHKFWNLVSDQKCKQRSLLLFVFRQHFRKLELNFFLAMLIP